MWNKIQVISFDMDGTLIPKDFADDFWLKKIPELYSKKYGVSEEKAFKILMEHYDEIGKEDIRWYQPEFWFSRYDLKQDPKKVLKGVREQYELYEDAKEAIEKLHGRYELIIISNGIKMFIETGLEDYKKYFSSLYSSISDFGMSMKTPSLYKKVSQEIATEPEKIVHIGDSLKNDYEPAEEAGMNPYLIDREKVEVKKSSGLHVLNDLRELSESPTL